MNSYELDGFEAHIIKKVEQKEQLTVISQSQKLWRNKSTEESSESVTQAMRTYSNWSTVKNFNSTKVAQDLCAMAVALTTAR